jgi:hypothetical protein
MKFRDFLKDKLLLVLIYLVCYFIILMMLIAFKSETSLIVAITVVFLILGFSLLLIEFFRRKNFYDELKQNVERLDQKYLVLETISKPQFYEGEIIYNSLYEIDKSMLENVNNYSISINDFKEYIEMWIHEVKIPISSLVLMCHNHKEKIDKKYISQIKRLDNYIDQILYYVRSENVEKDFMIKETKLDKIIGNVALRNKDDLLENKVDLDVDVKNIDVLTDAKWLEFILNQIINNSIKYKKENEDSFIKISALDNKVKIVLSIYDNGIGIPKSDLTRVFNKSFTGTNGRLKTKSTGMGLYIAKKLCEKLGHTISINSEVNDYTEVKITFSKNDFYKIKD